MSSLLIRNIKIADGSGAAIFQGEVLIENDTITAVGEKLSLTADFILDGKNLLLTPGFIDVHGHSDISIFAIPSALGKVSQGITSEIAGNCGLSPFPITNNNREHLQNLYKQYKTELTWKNYGEYKEKLAALPAQLKINSFCGHNSLRSAIVGYEKTTLTNKELNLMCKLLEQELSAGAVGLSSGLLYTPGCFSDTSELTELLKIVAKYNKIYSTHLRSEGTRLLEAIKETIELAHASGVKKILISHLKTAGVDNWHKLDKVFELLQNGRKSGLEILFDRYPYIESMTQLSIVAPGRFSSMSVVAKTKELTCSKAFDELLELLYNNTRDWSKVRLVACPIPEYSLFQGIPVSEIAKKLAITPELLVANFLKKDSPATTAAFCGMSYDNMQRIIASKYCMCGSDESARGIDYDFGRSHPRGFGSFPVFFQELKKQNIDTSEIIYRFTGLPAKFFNLSDRGFIKPGNKADLVLLDENVFNSPANFSTPHKPCTGVEKVWLNGKTIYKS